MPAKQVSKETGIPYGTLRDLVFRNEIPVIKLGAAWYFERADVDGWIDANKSFLNKAG